jgi:hypothetical protein
MTTSGFKRFEKGLKQYNLTVEEFQSNYKVLRCDKDKEYEEIPPDKKYCICGVKIKINKHVRNIEEYDLTKRILVVGRCCIKKFVPEENRKKLCGNCKRAHKNKTFNLCKECEYNHCYVCYKLNSNNEKTKHLMCNDCIKKQFGKLEEALREKYKKINIKKEKNKYYLMNDEKEIIIDIENHYIKRKYNTFKKSNDNYINDLDLKTLTHVRVIDGILQSKFDKIKAIYQPLGDTFKVKIEGNGNKIKLNYIWNNIYNGQQRFGILPIIM